MSSSKIPAEFQLIERIQAMLASAAAEKGVILGIGDDCAVLEGAEGKYLLVTTDMLIEDVHFSRAFSSLHEIGQKAMIVNISDIAAMGGEPRFAFISLAFPSSFSLEEFDQLWEGMIEVARRYSLLVLGGDTNASFPQLNDHGLVINITLIGEVQPSELISRQGAGEGDLILLTGQIGDSAAGLDLLTSRRFFAQAASGSKPEDICCYQQAVQRHRVPVVRLSESRIISRHHLATAMIDVSDGVATDLRHLLCPRLGGQREMGELGAILWPEKIPVSEAAAKVARMLGKEPLTYALCGGEDYELLFTATPDQAYKAKELIERQTLTSVSIIGEITEKVKGIHLIDGQGQIAPFLAAGFDHFKR